MAYSLIPRYFINNQCKIFQPRKLLPNKRVIVSLTSFPARLEQLWIVINCLFRQTCLPDKIVLWLSKEEVSSLDKVPDSLKSLQNDIFEIRIVDGSYRSHMKYYYALQEFCGLDDLVITVDDDLFYPPQTIEMLLLESEKTPNAIVANIVKRITFKDAILQPYNTWEHVLGHGITPNLFFLGAGGVLYPSGSLNNEVFNHESFMNICKLADDVWLNAMAIIQNTTIIHTASKALLIEADIDKATGLNVQNVGQNLNDVQIKNVNEYCKQLFDRVPFEY